MAVEESHEGVSRRSPFSGLVNDTYIFHLMPLGGIHGLGAAKDDHGSIGLLVD
jgi:hypothetical protein